MTHAQMLYFIIYHDLEIVIFETEIRLYICLRTKAFLILDRYLKVNILNPFTEVKQFQNGKIKYINIRVFYYTS